MTGKAINDKIAQIQQAMMAALRPLPTQTGDGSYIQTPNVTGLAQDLSHVDLKDAETLAEVAKTALTGETVNDRDYIMERVIQVCAYAVSYPYVFSLFNSLLLLCPRPLGTAGN